MNAPKAPREGGTTLQGFPGEKAGCRPLLPRCMAAGRACSLSTEDTGESTGHVLAVRWRGEPPPRAPLPHQGAGTGPRGRASHPNGAGPRAHPAGCLGSPGVASSPAKKGAHPDEGRESCTPPARPPQHGAHSFPKSSTGYWVAGSLLDGRSVTQKSHQTVSKPAPPPESPGNPAELPTSKMHLSPTCFTGQSHRGQHPGGTQQLPPRGKPTCTPSTSACRGRWLPDLSTGETGESHLLRPTHPTASLFSDP